MTPAQKRFMADLTGTEGWQVGRRSDWRTAVALLIRGQISIKVGNEEFHGLPAEPSAVFVNHIAPAKFFVQRRKSWNEAIQEMADLKPRKTEPVEEDEIPDDAGWDHPAVMARIYTPEPPEPPKPEPTPEEREAARKQSIRSDFDRIRREAREATTGGYDYRERSPEEMVGYLASTVESLVDLVERLILGDEQ